jgi:hypothetical protein
LTNAAATGPAWKMAASSRTKRVKRGFNAAKVALPQGFIQGKWRSRSLKSLISGGNRF